MTTAQSLRKKIREQNIRYLSLRSYYDRERQVFHFSPELHDVRQQITNTRNTIVELQAKLTKSSTKEVSITQ